MRFINYLPLAAASALSFMTACMPTPPTQNYYEDICGGAADVQIEYPQGFDKSDSKLYPVVVYFHGAGARSTIGFAESNIVHARAAAAKGMIGVSAAHTYIVGDDKLGNADTGACVVRWLRQQSEVFVSADNSDPESVMQGIPVDPLKIGVTGYSAGAAVAGPLGLASRDRPGSCQLTPALWDNIPATPSQRQCQVDEFRKAVQAAYLENKYEPIPPFAFNAAGAVGAAKLQGGGDINDLYSEFSSEVQAVAIINSTLEPFAFVSNCKLVDQYAQDDIDSKAPLSSRFYATQTGDTCLNGNATSILGSDFLSYQKSTAQIFYGFTAWTPSQNGNTWSIPAPEDRQRLLNLAASWSPLDAIKRNAGSLYAPPYMFTSGTKDTQAPVNFSVVASRYMKLYGRPSYHYIDEGGHVSNSQNKLNATANFFAYHLDSPDPVLPAGSGVDPRIYCTHAADDFSKFVGCDDISATSPVLPSVDDHDIALASWIAYEDLAIQKVSTLLNSATPCAGGSGIACDIGANGSLVLEQIANGDAYELNLTNYPINIKPFAGDGAAILYATGTLSLEAVVFGSDGTLTARVHSGSSDLVLSGDIYNDGSTSNTKISIATDYVASTRGGGIYNVDICGDSNCTADIKSYLAPSFSVIETPNFNHKPGFMIRNVASEQPNSPGKCMSFKHLLGKTVVPKTLVYYQYWYTRRDGFETEVVDCDANADDQRWTRVINGNGSITLKALVPATGYYKFPRGACLSYIDVANTINDKYVIRECLPADASDNNDGDNVAMAEDNCPFDYNPRSGGQQSNVCDISPGITKAEPLGAYFFDGYKANEEMRVQVKDTGTYSIGAVGLKTPTNYIVEGAITVADVTTSNIVSTKGGNLNVLSGATASQQWSFLMFDLATRLDLTALPYDPELPPGQM